MVLEIQPGFVDRGADLSWLSQYPFEHEVRSAAAPAAARARAAPSHA